MTLRLASLSLALLLATAQPALSQNQSQITAVKRGSACAGCNLFQADFGGLSANGRNFAGARLRQSSLALATMSRARFNGADMRDIDAFGAVFTGANFSRANLAQASLVGVSMRGANLAGANLEGANFSGSDLIGVTGLTQSQLNGACGDESTKLPASLRIPSC